MLNSCIVNPKVGPLSSHSCDCSDANWTPQHQASKVRTHLSVALFAVFFPCSTKFTYCKQQPNDAETWQWGYKLVCFVAWYSFLYCRAGLNEARKKRRCKSIWYPLAANFTSGVGPYTGIVEPFKLILCVTTHPQFLTLELRVPISACLGQYGIWYKLTNG